MVTTSQLVLAALVSGGKDAAFGPLQIQKLLFLVDAEIPDLTDGPHFRFRPYKYGPFDETVYTVLEELDDSSLLVASQRRGYRAYALTPSGRAAGNAVLAALPADATRFMKDAAEWLRFSTFRRILSVIYRRYPEMAVNSVVPPLRAVPKRAAHSIAFPSFLSGVARLADFAGSLDPPLYGGASDREDARAMRADGEAIGDDFERALAEFAPPAPARGRRPEDREIVAEV